MKEQAVNIERQLKTDKLTAKERVEYLLDLGSFIEVDKIAGICKEDLNNASEKIVVDTVVTGYGTIEGRIVFVYSQDFTVGGGAIGDEHAVKITKIQDMALKMGSPIIGFIDSNGDDIGEDVGTLSAYGDIVHRNTISSGVIPQISVILGPCLGGATFIPALSDFIFVIDKTNSMLTSKVAHFVDKTEEESIDRIRELLSFLPSNNLEEAPIYEPYDNIMKGGDDLYEIIPEDFTQPYDMKEVIQLISDEEYFFELQPYYAKNIVIGYLRLDGKTIGIVANVSNGLLDINAADKAIRFIRTCDAFNIPILNLVDVAGFLSSNLDRDDGINRQCANMINAYNQAIVPKVTLVIKKAYGSAYHAMCSKATGADQVFAWPSAKISISDFDEKAEANPYSAAEKGLVDDVIFPSITRSRLISTFNMLRQKVINK